MIVEVKVNELPESVADGTLVAWHKQPGDAVKADEALAEIETDKVVLEIAAPGSGIVGPQLRKKGDQPTMYSMYICLTQKLIKMSHLISSLELKHGIQRYCPGDMKFLAHNVHFRSRAR